MEKRDDDLMVYENGYARPSQELTAVQEMELATSPLGHVIGMAMSAGARILAAVIGLDFADPRILMAISQEVVSQTARMVQDHGRRFAIIGAADPGHQPMKVQDGKVQIWCQECAEYHDVFDVQDRT